MIPPPAPANPLIKASDMFWGCFFFSRKSKKSIWGCFIFLRKT